MRMGLHPPSFYYHVPLLLVLLFGGRHAMGQNNNTIGRQNNTATTNGQNETRLSGGRSYNFGSLDWDMKTTILEWGVRGASIAFFDKVRWKPKLVPIHALCRVDRFWNVALFGLVPDGIFVIGPHGTL